MMLTIYTDGGSRNQNGRCGWGVVGERDGNIVFRSSTFGGTGTNNEAEWKGLIDGAKAALSLGESSPRLKSDSMLVVKQALGEYKVKNNRLKVLKSEFADLPLLNPTIQWVKAHCGNPGNEEADRLATEALLTGNSWMEWLPNY